MAVMAVGMEDMSLGLEGHLGGLVPRPSEGLCRCVVVLLLGGLPSVPVAPGRWLSGSEDNMLQFPLSQGQAPQFTSLTIPWDVGHYIDCSAGDLAALVGPAVVIMLQPSRWT